MFPFRVLNQEQVERILDMRSTIEIVENAYTLKDKGEASLFPVVFHEFIPDKADMDIKSGHLDGAGVFGLKLVSWFGDNPSRGIPSLLGVVLVLDSRSGVPLGILSGRYITVMRTGAAGGIGAKYLARQDSRHLLMVGTGNIAAYQVAATLMAMEHIERVTVFNPNSTERAEQFAAQLRLRLREEFLSHVPQDNSFYQSLVRRFDIVVDATNDIERSTREADIIITATPARRPLIQAEWVQPGTHISCMGADMSGKQELDEQLFARARVFVDDIHQAVRVGECEIPIQKGIISNRDIISEIGSVIRGSVSGRVSADDITIFDSTGLALQDLLTADYILKRAKDLNIGTVTDL